jgi:ribosomal protein S18 acetylase RimI-like enzyme
MIVTRATVEDLAKLLELQKLAYQSEATLYQDDTLPPLTQTLIDMTNDFDNQFILKALVNNKIIGSVRACMEQDICHIGRLIVHPDYQNQGVGTRLMHVIEQCFPRARRFELFTGHLSERNLHLYQKLGYQIVWREKVHDRLDLVHMEKRR